MCPLLCQAHEKSQPQYNYMLVISIGGVWSKRLGGLAHGERGSASL